jgi:hypothetical protein
MKIVPTAFQALFPSSPVENLEPERDRVYIIETLLKNASLKAWRWMLTNYSSAEISSVIKRAKSLKKRDVLLWSYLLQISQKEILCLQTKFPAGLNSSWVY